ncbi:MAG: YihY family inner membrane protein, partial [Gammaproteobacteria bacterium]|nr:YihY family inner membrane protein [Gammaproteobacteria bacterium]
FIFLIIVALMMMANIDRAFNTIWRVRRKRGLLSLFIVYWSILSLGPLLIGISMAVTSYLVSIPLLSNTAETLGLKGRLIGLMPVLASAVAFTLLYAVVPNRRVPFRHALMGGLLAAALFELAKRGFAFYLTNFPTYEAIYGALAVIPIFLVWIYVSWVVTLLGAEFSYCLGVLNDVFVSGARERGQGFLLAFRVLRELWSAQKSGNALSSSQLSDAMGRVSDQ